LSSLIGKVLYTKNAKIFEVIVGECLSAESEFVDSCESRTDGVEMPVDPDRLWP